MSISIYFFPTVVMYPKKLCWCNVHQSLLIIINMSHDHFAVNQAVSLSKAATPGCPPHCPWPGLGALPPSASRCCCRVSTLYLLHLVVWVGAILTLTRHKMADSDTADQRVLYQQKNQETRLTRTRLRTLAQWVLLWNDLLFLWVELHQQFVWTCFHLHLSNEPASGVDFHTDTVSKLALRWKEKTPWLARVLVT